MRKRVDEISTLHVEVRAEADPIPISMLSDDELYACIEEANKRRLADWTYDREYAELAYHELKGGRLEAGLCLLDRALFCKKLLTANTDNNEGKQNDRND